MKSVSFYAAIVFVVLFAPVRVLHAIDTLQASKDGVVTVEATITQEVSPTELYVYGTCQVVTPGTREFIEGALQKRIDALKQHIDGNGRIRQSGNTHLYEQYYESYSHSEDSSAATTYTYSKEYVGDVGVLVKVMNRDQAQFIFDLLQEADCTPAWDPRLGDTSTMEQAAYADLLQQITNKKKFFESMLGLQLTYVFDASLDTYLGRKEGYYLEEYNPRTDSVYATTTLSITFDLKSAQ